MVDKKKKVTKKNEKNSISVWALSGVGVLLVGAIIWLSIALFNKGDVSDTYRLAKAMANEIKGAGNVSFIENGKDEQYEYSYLDTVAIYTDLVDRNDFTVAIARYNSNAEALKKVQFIKDFNAAGHKRFDNTVVEITSFGERFFSDYTLVVRGKYVFSINNKVKNPVFLVRLAERIVKGFEIKDEGKVDFAKLNTYWTETTKGAIAYVDECYKDILAHTKQEILSYVDELGKCKGDECEEILIKVKDYAVYPEVRKEVRKVQEKYLAVTKNKAKTVKSIEKALTKLEKKINKKDYDALVEKISNLTDMYYDQYKTGWQSRLTMVKNRIETKESKETTKKTTKKKSTKKKTNKR